MADRMSFWAWGLESEEPTDAARQALARDLSERYGTEITARPLPNLADAEMRAPRITAPDALSGFCFDDVYERARHAYGAHLTDRTRAFNLDFPNPPDVVAHPRTEAELEAVLGWCHDNGHAVVPYGGGSSVVWGVDPPEGPTAASPSTWTASTRCSRSTPPRARPASRPACSGRPWRASSAAGLHPAPLPPVVRVLHPGRLDRHPLGRPLRHQPHPHRRLRRIGADADADRAVGVAAPARQRRRAQPRPDGHRQRRHPRHHHRGVDAHPGPPHVPRLRRGDFRSWEAGSDAARHVAQAKLWPANCRLLDPAEARRRPGSTASRRC